MFPLGTVLVPGAGLPLHVFEPRYRALVHDALAGERALGVVLIERGSEVGGGDVRTEVGTRGRIVEATELPDGRWAIGVAGERRLRVARWLDDDPYPRAMVTDWPDPPPGPGHAAALEAAVAMLRRCLALAAEVGDRAAPATLDLAADPVLRGYQATALAPLGPLDRQRLLAAPSPDARVADLASLLREAIEVLTLRIGASGDG
jgi:Lon protease-like protein